MSSLSLIVLLTVTAVALAAPQPNIPAILEICKRTPDIDKCISRSLQRFLPAAAKGLPELGIPQLEPFLEEYSKIEHYTGAGGGQLEFFNVKTIGWTKCTVGQTRSNLHLKNPKEFSIEIDILFPSIVLDGKYKAKGKLIGLDIKAQGPFKLSLTNVNATWQITGVTEKFPDNEDHLVVKRFWMKPKVEKMIFYSDGLFGDNKELNKATNDFANEYWPVLYEELIPPVQHLWNNTMSGTTNELFKRIPLSQLILEP